VSSATADSPTSATIAARSSTPLTADRTVADSEALAVSNVAARTSVEKVDGREAMYFEDTMDGMRHRMRTQFARRVTPEFLAQTDYQSQSAPVALQGPNPCDACASGASFESDQLPTAMGGSGLPDPCQIDCTISGGTPDVGWRGANDHCLFNGDTLFEDPNLKEVLPSFTMINQVVNFCGATMTIDNACHTGDANGASRSFDPDVHEYQIDGIPALDMKMTAYSEVEGIRIAMTYNFFDQTNNANFGPITSCSDGYGIFVFPVWQSFEILTTANCADGTWGESLQEGYWYILCFPAAGEATGCPRSLPQTIDGGGNPINAWYYNVTLESIDPEGACCDTDTMAGSFLCTDDVAKSVCFTMAGVFKGAGSTCAETSCCSPINDLALDYDFSENDNDFSDGEDLCSAPGATQDNEIAFDFEGNVLSCGATPLTIGGAPSLNVDICDDYDGMGDPNDPAIGPNADGTYVIVGYSGTEDSFSSSFASSSFSQGDDDVFVFEIPGPDAVRIEAVFDVPYSYVGYIVRDFGSSVLTPECDVIGFISPGITAPCQQTRVSSCLSAGVHGVYMQMFQTANVACNVAYTITINCLECAPGACCLKNGMCLEGLADPDCEFGMGGNFQGNYSSCCVSTCEVPCDGGDNDNPPNSTTSGAADDDCTDYTCANDPAGVQPCPTSPVTITGDLFNSGCEAPDGNQSDYWTTAAGAVDRLWCANTGTYILDAGPLYGGIKDFYGDIDYIELDLSGETTDTQVAITINSQVPLTIYVARGRALEECPSPGVDGTDDIRELAETVSVGTGNIGGLQAVTLTLCLANDEHMILLETTSIIDCGFFYSIQIDCEADCMGACCHSNGGGCTNVAEDSSDTARGPQNCNQLFGAGTNPDPYRGGVYRGLGTRCPGTGGTNPLDRETEIDCCDFADEMGDVIDDDAASCATVISSGGADDLNGGCAQGTAAAYQSLGTLDPASGANPGDPGDSVAVYGTTGVGRCGTPTCFPPRDVRDRDIYSFDVPAGPDAEALFFLRNNFTEFVRLLDADDFGPLPVPPDPALCDFNTVGLSSFTINSTTCTVDGQTFGISGLQTTGQSNCLDNGETHYIYVAPFNNTECSVDYRFEITLYECMLGACCLDNSLCVGDDDVGYLECEAILGGTFVENASCPTGVNEGTLCLGICCIDDDMDPMTPVVCVTDTLYQECCATNVALDQDDPNAPGFTQGSFAGYQVGFDPASCGVNTCVDSGACCIDSVGSGYACSDDVTPDDCGTMGGTYQGNDTTCAGTGCDDLNGGCCVGMSCTPDVSPLFCGGLGGSFLGAGTDCSGDPCAPTGGACCWSCPDGGLCVDGSNLTDCTTTLKGVYAGDGSTCATEVCDASPATPNTLCRCDLTGDGLVSVLDFSPAFTGGFLNCPPSVCGRCEGDFNCDGFVDVNDFSIFTSDFGCSIGAPTGQCP
jgi:hypothetical protein